MKKNRTGVSLKNATNVHNSIIYDLCHISNTDLLVTVSNDSA